MRDIVLTVFLFGSIPFILKRPWYGVILWVWVSVMSPHRLTWGFAYDLPFAQLIALATMASLFMSRDPKHFPLTPPIVVLCLLIAWMSLTTLFALSPAAPIMWEKVMKTMLMTFVTMYVLSSKRHILMLVVVLALSVGFYGAKGGWFTLTGGGMEKVYGPGGSFIEENNSLALAVIMTIPLLRFLQVHATDIMTIVPLRFLQAQATNVWVKWGLVLAMVLCGFSALGSHSRGALLGIAGMLLFFWSKSRNKVMTGMLLVILLPVAITFMPESWDKRMRTIENYEEDSSAMGRINAWKMAINVASDRIMGGGFEMYTGSVFAAYAPNPRDIHTAHSIYFQMLGEHGFIGLALFLLLGILVYRDASWIISRTKGLEQWQWAGDLARMIQVSMVAFALGGAFLNLAYYDVPYYLIVALVLTRRLVEKEVDWKPAPFFRGPQGTATPRPAAAARGPGGPPVVGSGQRPISKAGSGP